ncbi:MAG: hypothetical protein AAGC68_00225 [Verrucomicrobiota bacterium]
MKYTSTRSRQRGGISGKLLFLLVIVALFFMVKNGSTKGKVMGQGIAVLQAEYGQPISKEKIPRPS